MITKPILKSIMNPVMDSILVEDDTLQLKWLLSGQGKIPTKADDYGATFVRDDVGTYIDKDDGVFKEAAANRIREEANGYLFEPERQNKALWSQQFQQAGTWIQSNITPAQNTAVAPDGTTTMDTLTATAGNATLLQTITSASNDRVFSKYLERKTGSGVIQLTVNGGADWETVTVNNTEPTRVTITKAGVTDPVFGIRIVDSGDAVYAWQADMEIGLAPTSSIVTTTIPVTRLADDLRLPVADGTNWTQAQGTLICEYTPSLDEADVYMGEGIINIKDGTSGVLYHTSNGNFATFDGVNLDAIDANFTSGVTIKCFVRWGTLLTLGLNGTQNASPESYNGSFVIGTDYIIGRSMVERFWLKTMRIYNIDKGQAFCEAETA